MEEEITFTELINEVLEMEIEPIIEEIPSEPIIEEMQIEPIIEEIPIEPIIEEMQIEPIIEEIPIEPILKVPQLSSYGLLDRYLIKY